MGIGFIINSAQAELHCGATSLSQGRKLFTPHSGTLPPRHRVAWHITKAFGFPYHDGFAVHITLGVTEHITKPSAFYITAVYRPYPARYALRARYVPFGTRYVLRTSDWLPEILLGYASYCSAVRLRLRFAQDDTGGGCDSPGDINPLRDLRYTLSAR